jgi:hypothetical protein
MALMSIPTFATMVAMYVQKNMRNLVRGALLIRCVNDGSTVAAVFGNDNYAADNNVRREVDLVRQELTQSQIEKLGFGVAPDGATWTLVARSDNGAFQTAAGKAFHMELFRIFLEDTVQAAWCNASGVTPNNDTSGVAEYPHATP